MQYQVIQQHFGDKQYFAGDLRTVDNEQDAQYLIAMGLIAVLEYENSETDDENSEATKAKPKKSNTKEV